MLFGEMWLKIQKTTILAWFAREASNLEVKLDLKRGFNNWYFERNFYFAVPVIKATKSKNCEKKSKFARLPLGKCVYAIFEFFRDNRPSALFWILWKFSIWNFVLEKNV